MNDANIFGLSPQQRRAWQVGESGAAPGLTVEYLFGPGANVERWIVAVGTVLARHEILHSSLVRLPGHAVPGQRVDADGAVAVEVHDSTEAVRAAWADEGHGVVRAAVVPGGDECRGLFWLPATHGDRSTAAIILGELARGYGGRDRPPPELQYADVAGWLEDVLTEPLGLVRRTRWNEAIKHAARNPLLPFQRPTTVATAAVPAARRVVPMSVPFRGDVGDMEPLVLTIWRLLLCRVTESEEVTIAVASDGRDRAELVELPGPLARFLPVPGGVGASLSWRAAIAAEAERLNRARGSAAYFSWPDPGRSSRPPTVSFAFEYFSWPAARRVGGSLLELARCEGNTDHATVLLRCVRTSSDLQLELVVEPAALPEAYADCLLDQLASALAHLDSGEGSVGTVRYLSDDALSAAVAVGTGPRHPDAGDAPFPHERVARQCVDRPDATALVVGDRELTYGQLGARVAGMTAALQRVGVGPECIVAVILPRGVQAVVAMIAVLAAGGVYAPIDPANPSRRLRRMVEALAPTVTIVDEYHRGRIPPGFSVLEHVEPLDGPPRRPEPVLSFGAAALIHTSGSTGDPKGVTLTHAGLRNRLDFAQRAFPLAAHDRVLWSAAVGFDFTLYEVLAPLSVGAALVIPDPAYDVAPSYLADLLGARQVTVAHFTPSMLALVLAEAAFSRADRLRLVLVGGEALRVDVLASLRRRTSAAVVNQYGPTEATIDVTTWPVRATDQPDAVCIGAPIDNVSVHVLDERLDIRPTGMTGELYLGGVAVARGYHGMPGATADRFIPDPYGEPGSRLYRTGDFARRRPDGLLEFVGRRDDQVGVRGYRIELGEVETALRSCTGVSAAAVAVVGANSENARLFAFVTVDGAAVNGDSVRAQLQQRLPAQMVPSRIVVVPSLPLTPSGKVDRGALARLTGVVDLPVGTPPIGDLEAALAQAWQDLLPEPAGRAIGRDDDFYQLGGHSLIALRVLSFIHRELGVALPLGDLLASPTVGKLAERIEAHEPRPGHARRAARIWLRVGNGAPAG